MPVFQFVLLSTNHTKPKRVNRAGSKLPNIIEMLRQASDEDHPLRTSEMVRRLEALNISSERRTLSKDIATLNAQGYEIPSAWVNREKAFYVVDRAFSVPEIIFCLIQSKISLNGWQKSHT